METKSLIQAFRKALSEFNPNTGSSEFPEKFAIARFFKKYQEPNSNLDSQLQQRCWDDWIKFDSTLPRGSGHFYSVFQKNPGFWYSVRQSLSQELSRISLKGDVEFSPGSTFTATLGKNSIESKLSALPWDCTRDNFDNFAKVCYANNALKKAARVRWNVFLRRKGWSRSFVNKTLYEFFSRNSRQRAGFDIFRWKLQQIVVFQHGSRFTSVPKNNETRRPINIEPFCNIVVQKLIGSNLRSQLKRIFDIDLDTLSDKHRERISDSSVATIDLKNASDSISIELCRFLLPKHVFDMLMEARSPMILGHDGSFHFVTKMSAMGNGFTFELMSLILTSICRKLDSSSSVFGDDIIITKSQAPRLIELLEDVGFVVNTEKSFTSGPFRESCGGNYHDDYGYIESFDFRYPENIHDCVVLYNKARRLSYKYESFKFLERQLYRHIPIALRGTPDSELKSCDYRTFFSDGVERLDSAPVLSNYFRTGYSKKGGSTPSRQVVESCEKIQIKPERVIIGFEPILEERTRCAVHLKSSQYAKYLMYLHAGRRTKDLITGSVRHVKTYFVVADNRVFRLKSLLKPEKVSKLGEGLITL